MSRNSSFLDGQYFLDCEVSVANKAVFTSFFFSYSICFPLFVFVLWQLSRRCSASGETRDSDVFTLQIVLLQIIGLLAISLYCYGAFTKSSVAVEVGLVVFSSIAPGETMFHVLTCVERYLAVFHPVAYRGLRQSGGVKIRNVCVGCVWLLCAAISCVSVNQLLNIIFIFLLLVFASVAVTYCSISVLFVLIRPLPGEAGVVHKKVNRAKQKAFYTIVVILTTLIIRFLSYLAYTIVYALLYAETSDPCLFFWSVYWFSLPSILVLPLIFLYRIGKVPRCGRVSVGFVRKPQHAA